MRLVYFEEEKKPYYHSVPHIWSCFYL